jgi:hypothetical protein
MVATVRRYLWPPGSSEASVSTYSATVLSIFSA